MLIFQRNKTKTNKSEKELRKADKLAIKGMKFDYPKWSPLSYQPTNRNKYKNLSSFYDNKTEVSQNRISIDA